MDNRLFDITDDGNLLAWMKCCMGKRKAVGWSMHEEEKGSRLVLYWTAPRNVTGYHPLPAPADAEVATTLVNNWLNLVEYGPQPQHDGSNKRGFRLYCEAWGHVDDHYEALMGITPVWALIGK